MVIIGGSFAVFHFSAIARTFQYGAFDRFRREFRQASAYDQIGLGGHLAAVVLGNDLDLALLGLDVTGQRQRVGRLLLVEFHHASFAFG